MSEYLKESYEAALRENEELTKRIVSVERERDEIMAMAERREGELQARLADAEALLLETCERMSEAETTSRVLTGQLPEYSEGQQMLRSLAAKMGDSVKRIRAFFAPDSASGEGEK